MAAAIMDNKLDIALYMLSEGVPAVVPGGSAHRHLHQAFRQFGGPLRGI